MTVAHNTALHLLNRYRPRLPFTEPELTRLCCHLGAQVRLLPRQFPLREFRAGRYIGIRRDEPRPWRLWLLAHGLGHYLLHRGDQFSIDSWWIIKQERQADEFAGWLLLAWVPFQWEPWRVAEECDVPYECVRRWERLVTDRDTRPLGC